MDYLQYYQIVRDFIIDLGNFLVLNLVINGLPSILK